MGDVSQQLTEKGFHWAVQDDKQEQVRQQLNEEGSFSGRWRMDRMGQDGQKWAERGLVSEMVRATFDG